MGKGMGKLSWIASFLIAIALINWGLVAWFGFNLITWITFGVGWLATAIYTIVAILGLIGLFDLIRRTF